MGRTRNKRKRANSTQSSMSSTPQTQMSNITYAVQNANETLYGPHSLLTNGSPPVSNKQNVQLGAHMHTSTPIPQPVIQTNAPQPISGLCQSQGQGPGQQNIALILYDIQNKLTKLDLLDGIADRLRNMEMKFDSMEQEMTQIKRSVIEHRNKLNTNDLDMRDFHFRINNLETAKNELVAATKEIHDTFLDQQMS